ncbi:hypothetical protein M3Y94_01223200 [Aphelenchoides besseyi]|nr:hypothetical protein M3Y94_01223200 [Aphelenchoides besseyi]
MDSAWTDANFKLDEWLPKMTNYTGMNFLFDVELSPKERGAQRLFFSASNLILKKAEMYVEPEYSQQLAALNAFVVEFMGTIGADLASTSTYETVKTAVDNALKLEAQIAQILIDEQVTDEQTLETTMSNPKTIDELKALGANLDWTKYLTDHPMLQDAEVKAYVQANPPIFIHTPEAIKQTLAAIDAKKKEAADYLMIRFILQQIPYLDERFSDSAYRFAWKLTEKVECFELIKRNFPLVVDYLYVEKFLNKKVLGKATELIDKLRQGLAVMLRSEENWMDPSNRAYAIQKLGNMKELDKKYENVVFGKNDKYTAMAAKIKLIEEARTYQSLIRAGGEYDKSTRADNTNPSHIYENNQIFIPAAVLEKSFVDFDLPSSLVYGSLGFIIGHELTHAFDAKGSEFDASGLRRKWWSETTNTEYEDRSQCLIDAYEQEEEPQTQKPVDGQLTQNENIADAGGLRAAFTSFNLNTERKDGPIAGFDDLNANQQFFVRFAINHCANLDRSYQEHLMETDPHTFSAARVNVVLRNYPEFAKAFQCPSGSPMNPEEQCSLW